MAEEEIKKESEASTPTLVDRAESVAKRIEEANRKTEELLKQQEAINARMMLSGRSDAGNTSNAPKVETPKEYKDRIMKGKI